MTKTKITLLAIVALVIGFTLGVYGDRASQPAKPLGGTSYDVLHQVADIHQGPQDALIATQGVEVGPVGGSALATLNLSTSSLLAAGFDCTYDTLKQTTSTASVTSTLPTAAQEDTCLTSDGAQDVTYIQIGAGNNFGMVLATSTGDTIVWNTSSTASQTLTTSTSGTFYKLEAVRFASSSIVWSLTFLGIGH